MITLHADRMMRSRLLRANVLSRHTREAARADMVAVPGSEFVMGSDAFYPDADPALLVPGHSSSG